MIVCMLQTVAGSRLKRHDFCRRRDFEERQGALPRGALKTVTFDNGGEFGQHQRLEAALGVAAYFCDPHSPWQRGTI